MRVEQLAARAGAKGFLNPDSGILGSIPGISIASGVADSVSATVSALSAGDWKQAGRSLASIQVASRNIAKAAEGYLQEKGTIDRRGFTIAGLGDERAVKGEKTGQETTITDYLWQLAGGGGNPHGEQRFEQMKEVTELRESNDAQTDRLARILVDAKASGDKARWAAAKQEWRDYNAPYIKQYREAKAKGDSEGMIAAGKRIVLVDDLRGKMKEQLMNRTRPATGVGLAKGAPKIIRGVLRDEFEEAEEDEDDSEDGEE